jgi:class 3 adenylate cyclase/tetratricopeptide (TPR) repeat protein
VISALFADLVGYTAHTERSDPEDVRARLATYHTRVRQDVERFGGHIEKLMGDGVFVVFGVPTAHEDDPERAVRAALRVQQSVGELNAAQPELALSVRIAVTTGEAIIQLGDSPDRERIIGDVVNTASRLQTIALPGQVMVDQRTYLAARAAVEFAAMEPVEVKGKSEPISVWGASGLRSRYGVAVEEDQGTPFVGRAEELSLLVDAFDRSVARRSPQLATVVGEPGVGKSRLVREFRRVLDDRPDLIWWRQGRCLPYGEGVTFWAIGEVVKSQAGILDSEVPELVAAKLRSSVENLVEDPAEAEWVRLRLGPLVGIGGSEEAPRSELFAAWLRFFEALATRNPLVLLIEDLQWADDAVVEFLQHLLQWAEDAPVFVVCTARPDLYTDRPDWGAGKRDALTIGLSPLSTEDTIRLMSALAERPLMDALAQRALVERSGGNPLYVTEYVRLASERGWLDRLRSGEELPLPDTVQSIIAARIDLLEPGDKALLQAAAVIGRVFWTGALAFVEGGKPSDLERRLRKLVTRELIRPVRRSSMQGQDEYSFAHVLVRDVAYARLTREDRARLHESTASWLEAVSGDRAIDVAELLAHHHSTALELRPSDDPERRRRVYRFLVLAAERARSFDAGRAASFYRSAVTQASTDLERGRALLELGQLDYTSTEETAMMLDQAIEAFTAAADREGQAEAWSARGRLEWFKGHAEAADRYDEQALALVAGLPASPVMAKVLLGAASRSQLRGQEEEALDLVEQALSVAREVGDTADYSRALVVRGSALIQMGQDDAISDVMEGLRIQLDRNDTDRAMRTYNDAATFYIANGQVGEGRRMIEESIAYGTQRGLPAHTDWSRMTRCEALFPMGELDELLQQASELLEADQRRGGSQIGTFSKAWAAVARFYRGESAEPRHLWEEVLAANREIQDPQGMMPALAFGIRIYEATGDVAQAVQLSGELTELGPEHPVFLTLHLPTAAAAMVRLGLVAELERLTEVAIGLSSWNAAQIDHARAAALEGRARPAEALGLLEHVIAVGDPLGLRLPTTEARIEGARCAIGMGRDEEGERLLGEATVAAKAMGSQRLIEEIYSMRPSLGAAAADG